MNSIVSLLSSLWVTLNLLAGIIVLIPVSLLSWISPQGVVRDKLFSLTELIYRSAVRVNSFWMKRVVGIELNIVGEQRFSANPVVLCNHQSWFDIPVLQDIVAIRGPIVKFLIKRELVWVPIIGWICVALRMPRLGRSKKSDTRERDREIVNATARDFANQRGALLLFPEGTRFTEHKRLSQASTCEHLLRPRAGGLELIRRAADPETELVDITIVYGKRNTRLWECLHGDPSKITVFIDKFKLGELGNTADWLNQRWVEKDRYFRQSGA